VSAQAQSRHAASKVMRAIRTGARLIATGCGAQLEPEAYLGLGADVLGNGGKDALPAILRRWSARHLGAGPQIDPSSLLLQPHQLEGHPWETPQAHTRAVIKVQDGCPLRCTYCIVPHLRGAPVSKAPETVLEEARDLVHAGHREIVLVGVNVGLYGVDSVPSAARRAGAPLAELIRRMSEIAGLVRIRLSSLEPMTLGDPLLGAFKEVPALCAHAHLSLQSGDDGVLARMGRPYSSADFLALCRALESARQGISIGVDVIAGFPGEDEDAFRNTLAVIERGRVAYLHAFTYSERPGTQAASLGQSVPYEVRKARTKRLRLLDRTLRLAFQARVAGSASSMIVEATKDGHSVGLADRYLRVEATGKYHRGAFLRGKLGDPLGPGRSAFLPEQQGSGGS